MPACPDPTGLPMSVVETLAQFVLRVSVTGCSFLVSASSPARMSRGARGIPRPAIAMMSRWSSLAPPPNVLMTAKRYACSSSPLSGAAESLAHAGLADDFEQFAGDLLGELSAEYLCRRGLAHR